MGAKITILSIADKQGAISTSDKEGGFKGCNCHHASHTWTLFMSFCFIRCRDQILLLFLFLIEIAKIQTLFVSSRSLKQYFPFSILIKSLSLSLSLSHWWLSNWF
jgi:uncharacterized membrane protein